MWRKLQQQKLLMSQAEPSTGDSTAVDGEDALAELRGVISFVCREKEITELNSIVTSTKTHVRRLTATTQIKL